MPKLEEMLMLVALVTVPLIAMVMYWNGAGQ